MLYWYEIDSHPLPKVRDRLMTSRISRDKKLFPSQRLSSTVRVNTALPVTPFMRVTTQPTATFRLEKFTTTAHAESPQTTLGATSTVTLSSPETDQLRSMLTRADIIRSATVKCPPMLHSATELIDWSWNITFSHIEDSMNFGDKPSSTQVGSTCSGTSTLKNFMERTWTFRKEAFQR